ncbi:MAG: YdhR family protein [Burkholderiaceae bacterium]
MITEYVLFDLPAGMTREQVIAGMHEVAPRWRGEPNLIRKTFVYDEQARVAGAFYLWHDRASAEAAHDEAWRARIRGSYGSEPRLRYFETPLVVDNALGCLVHADGTRADSASP